MMSIETNPQPLQLFFNAPHWLLLTGLAAVFIYAVWPLLAGYAVLRHDSVLWYPMYDYLARAIVHGDFPFWNPYIHGGEPFYYAINIIRLTDPIYLSSILVAKFSDIGTLDIYNGVYAARIFVTAVGVYALIYALTDSRWAAFVAVLAGLAGGFTSTLLVNMGSLDGLCWAPWIVFSAIRLLGATSTSRRFWSLAIAYFTGIYLGAAIYHWVLGAFVAVFFLGTMLVNGRDVLAKLYQQTRGSRILALTLLVALCAQPIVLVQERGEIFPAVRMVERQAVYQQTAGTLWGGYQQIASESRDIGKGDATFLLSLITPPSNVLPAIILMFIGLVFASFRFKHNFLLTIIACVIVYIGPRPELGSLESMNAALYRLFPPLSLVRHPTMLDGYLLLFAMILMGLGYQTVCRYTQKFSGMLVGSARGIGAIVRSTSIYIKIVIVVTVSALGAYLAVRHGQKYCEKENIVPCAITIALVIGVLVSSVAAYFKSTIVTPGWVGGAIAASILSSLVAASILTATCVQVSTTAIMKNVYKPLLANRSVYFKGFEFDDRPNRQMTYPLLIEVGLNLPMPYLAYAPALLGRTVVLDDILPPVPPSPQIYPPYFNLNFPQGLYHFWPTGYKDVYEVGEVSPSVYVRLMGIKDRGNDTMPATYPRFEFFEKYAVTDYATAKQALMRLKPAQSLEILADTVLLEKSPGYGTVSRWTSEFFSDAAKINMPPMPWQIPIPPELADWRSINDRFGPVQAEQPAIKLLSAGPNSVTVSVNARKSGILMFRDTYHRQWQVSVDGRSAELLRANINFKAVAIPAGEHEIRFSFIPWPFVIALLLYAVSNVVFLGYALFRSLPNGFMTRIGSKPASGVGTK